MQKIILIGDSGHSKVIEDSIRSNGDKIIAKLDDKYSEKFTEGSLVKGPISLLAELFSLEIKVVIAIGQNPTRKKIVDMLNLPRENYARIIHKSAVVGTNVKIGFGTVVMPGVVINADSDIGAHVIVNSNSTIEHDCKVEDFVHISPATTLTGNVSVAQGTQIGAGSVVIPGKNIGSWSMLGAGSTVLSDIPSNVTAVGVPAKVIKKEGL
ncbi:acetyltransferase [Solibacillus silvestris]